MIIKDVIMFRLLSEAGLDDGAEGMTQLVVDANWMCLLMVLDDFCKI